MFKWIALTVATLGIAALSYCFWPRAHLDNGFLVTPSGDVLYRDGTRAYVEPVKPAPFVPTPVKPGETPDEKNFRELMDYARSVGGTAKQ